MINFFEPTIGEEEMNEIRDLLHNKEFGTGKGVKEFERALKRYLGCEHVVALNSATNALYAVLKAKNILPGDRVAVSAFGWPSVAHAITFCGATPVFVDVDYNNFNMDPMVLDNKLQDDNIKAVVPVHCNGQPCDVWGIEDIAIDHDVEVVWDGSSALGSRYGNGLVGFEGTVVFSTRGNNVITTGEGGFVATNDLMIANWVRNERDMGIMGVMDADTRMRKAFLKPALDFRMSDINAVLGARQLSLIDKFMKRRREIAEFYDDQFKKVYGITTQEKMDNTSRNNQAYVIRCDKEEICERIMAKLWEAGIGCEVGGYSIPDTDAYGIYGNCENAKKLEMKSISLPIYPKLGIKEMQEVAKVVKDTVRAA